MPEVLLDVHELSKGVAYAVVTLNRPAAKNAMNRALSSQLAQALDDARKRADVRCVIVIGSGGAFSAGVDLKDPFFADASLMRRDSLDSPSNYIWQLQHTDVPLIAAVAGPCITGGFEIALNCDIIIAANSAVFRDTHTLYGIVPGGGMTQLLPRIIGLQAAKWMSLGAAKVDAQRALQLGLAGMVRIAFCTWSAHVNTICRST
jgi:enoyl-CoA hydratase